ncbi:hypothetical protein JCM5350_006315 [Sporobolomyces pararoseus]
MSSIAHHSQYPLSTSRTNHGRTSLTQDEEKALEGAEKTAIELVEEDEIYWDRSRNHLYDLVIKIVAQAIVNGDHVGALDVWRKSYLQVLHNANGTHWSLDLIERQLESTLHYVQQKDHPESREGKRANQITEEYERIPVQKMLWMKPSFRVMRRFEPFHKNWPFEAWWPYEFRERIDELVEELAESQGLSFTINSTRSYDSRINLIKDYREDLKNLLGVAPEVKPVERSHQFWLERDLELKILELLSKDKKFLISPRRTADSTALSARSRLETIGFDANIAMRRFEAHQRDENERKMGEQVFHRPSSSGSH